MSVGILGSLRIETQDGTVQVPHLHELDVTDGSLTATGPNSADLDVSGGGGLPSGWFAQPLDPGVKNEGSVWVTGLSGTMKMSDGFGWDHQIVLTVDGDDDPGNPDDDATLNIVVTAPGGNGAASATTVASSATSFATVQREATGAGDARGWTFVTSTNGDAIATTVATSQDGVAYVFAQAHATGDGDANASRSATADGTGQVDASTTATSFDGQASADITAAAMGDGSGRLLLQAQTAGSGDATAGMAAEADGTGLADLNLQVSRGVDFLQLEMTVDAVGKHFVLGGLPTADPGVTGELWNDAGTLKISI